MSEHHSAPHIRLQVDQEVFVEQVQNGDVIEDATVATEVTSFDRVGDAYVLEGAIVFAGYMKRDGEGERHTTAVNSKSSFAGEEIVQHVHHRMPFVLRVPTKSQQRGIVNVASRISSWNLEVISAGWIRVLADLTVVGLSKAHGYHFECGAQEEGDLFFSRDTEHESEPVALTEAPQITPQFVNVSDTEPELEFVRSFQEDTALNEEFDVPNYADAISESRGGHPLFTSAQPETVKPEIEKPDFIEPPSAFTGENTMQRDGEGFERNFHGNLDSPWTAEESADPESVNQATVQEETAFEFSRSTPRDESSLAEFEFVHQVNARDVEENDQSHIPDERFIPSRSFTDDGFKPTAAFAPSITFNENPSTFHEETSTDSSEEAYTDALTDTRESNFERTFNPLWSFVDFHAPEPSYTLRFIVVMDEETLDGVAERVGCLKSDLSRVNRLINDTVFPGQTLLVPTRAAKVV